MDNAFERARAAYGTGAYDDATLEFLFPQLKESEEDIIRRRLINLISELADAKLPVLTGGYFIDGQDKKYIAYLEKQRPAEWSEEDELMRTVVIQTLETFGGRGTTGMQIDWLKSLRPSWKPSEEQMKALQNAVVLAACDKELVRLYNQLKKLI